CLGCHGNPGLTMPDGNGGTRSLYVPADPFAHSVHSPLPCTACHAAITEVPHRNAPTTLAERRRQVPALCGTCHADALKDYLSSVHGRQVTEGSNPNAAICSDCHTAHAVAPPQLAATRLAITKDCGTCHEAALASYEETYHGKVFALGYGDI